jgi:hypothetical protein
VAFFIADLAAPRTNGPSTPQTALNILFTLPSLPFSELLQGVSDLMAASKSNITLRKANKSGAKQASLTREQIEEDLAAFRKSGGKIERLGNTNTFKKIG